MEFENKEARNHFLKYALVSKCKNFSKNQREENIRKYLVERIDPPAGIENNYPTAKLGCDSIAKSKGLEYITKGVSDEWFLEKHNQISPCKAYKGTVTWKGETKAKVLTSVGKKRKYKTKIKPDVNIGSKVIVHNDYIIDVLE